MSKTENGIRYYTCKVCGSNTQEPVRKWRKQQKDKNICNRCIEGRRLAAQTRKEMLEDAAYRARYLRPF